MTIGIDECQLNMWAVRTEPRCVGLRLRRAGWNEQCCTNGSGERRLTKVVRTVQDVQARTEINLGPLDRLERVDQQSRQTHYDAFLFVER